jgi:ornithine carbamoyltransferase
MLAAERRSGNQIFAHCLPANDDGVETNLSDEARCNISSVRVAAPWGMSAFEGKADIVWT